jgi:glyoxylase I family protein
LAGHPFEVYEPGLHHIAFNVGKHEHVDQVCELVKRLGGRVTDGPGEFPFGGGGYYAVYFRGPDDLKFEVVHMPFAERRMAEIERLVRTI